MPYWAATTEIERSAGVVGVGGVHALPGYDEYILGYQDRSFPLDAEHLKHIVPGGNGAFLPMIVSRGKVVGTWQRTTTKNGVTVSPHPFGELGKGEAAGFERAVNAYTAFFA